MSLTSLGTVLVNPASRLLFNRTFEALGGYRRNADASVAGTIPLLAQASCRRAAASCGVRSERI